MAGAALPLIKSCISLAFCLAISTGESNFAVVFCPGGPAQGTSPPAGIPACATNSLGTPRVCERNALAIGLLFWRKRTLETHRIEFATLFPIRDGSCASRLRRASIASLTTVSKPGAPPNSTESASAISCSVICCFQFGSYPSWSGLVAIPSAAAAPRSPVFNITLPRIKRWNSPVPLLNQSSRPASGRPGTEVVALRIPPSCLAFSPFSSVEKYFSTFSLRISMSPSLAFVSAIKRAIPSGEKP